MRQHKTYGLFNGRTLVRISTSKQELINDRNSLPEGEKKEVLIAEKIIAGPKEHQQSHWFFDLEQEAQK